MQPLLILNRIWVGYGNVLMVCARRQTNRETFFNCPLKRSRGIQVFHPVLKSWRARELCGWLKKTETGGSYLFNFCMHVWARWLVALYDFYAYLGGEKWNNNNREIVSGRPPSLLITFFTLTGYVPLLCNVKINFNANSTY